MSKGLKTDPNVCSIQVKNESLGLLSLARLLSSIVACECLACQSQQATQEEFFHD